MNHRSVSGPAPCGQPHPQQTLLGCLDEVQPALAAIAPRQRDRESADLTHRFADTGEQVGPIAHQPLRSVLAAALLVSDEREHQIPRRHDAGPLEVTGDGQHHPAHILHIDGAATPDITVGDRARERVDTPIRGLSRNHIEVTVDQQRPAGGVGTGQPGKDIAAPGGSGLEILRGVPHLAQLLSHPLGALSLTLGGLQLPGVGGVKPDQGADEPHHLVRRIRHGSFPTIDTHQRQTGSFATTSLSQTTFTTRAPWGSIYR